MIDKLPLNINALLFSKNPEDIALGLELSKSFVKKTSWYRIKGQVIDWNTTKIYCAREGEEEVARMAIRQKYNPLIQGIDKLWKESKYTQEDVKQYTTKTPRKSVKRRQGASTRNNKKTRSSS